MTQGCEICRLPLHLYHHSCPEGCNNNLCLPHCSQQFDGTNRKDTGEKEGCDKKTDASQCDIQSVSIELNFMSEEGAEAAEKEKEVKIGHE